MIENERISCPHTRPYLDVCAVTAANGVSGSGASMMCDVARSVEVKKSCNVEVEAKGRNRRSGRCHALEQGCSRPPGLKVWLGDLSRVHQSINLHDSPPTDHEHRCKFQFCISTYWQPVVKSEL
jgi:hypothetical protein